MEAQGMNTIQYFSGRQFIGERTEYCFTTPWGDKTFSCFYPHAAYFCSECGEIWGRAVYQHHPGYQPIPRAKWIMHTRPCVRHGDGTFLELLTPEALLHCDLGLLKYEAEALLFNYKESSNG